MRGGETDIVVYLGTMDVGLKFEQNKKVGELIGYIDSNLPSDLNKHHLIIGYMFALARGLVN